MSKMFKLTRAFVLAVCAAALLCGTASAAEKAIDFGVIDEAGKQVRLSSFSGTPVIVNFWATWCPPCREELPAFDKVAAEFKGKVQFMMVDLADGYDETVEDAKEFVAHHGYNFPLFFDTEEEGAMAYGLSAVPTTIVISSNGEIVKRHIGGLDEKTLRGYAKRIAGGK